MINKLLVAINLLMVSAIIYVFFLFFSHLDEFEENRINSIQNSQVIVLFERLKKLERSLLNGLPLTQIKSGFMEFNTKVEPSVVKPSGCEANRGLFQHRILFQKAFDNVPEVSVGLSGVDFRDGTDHRLKVEVTDISKFGFTANLITWCDTKISFASANWIAFYSL